MKVKTAYSPERGTIFMSAYQHDGITISVANKVSGGTYSSNDVRGDQHAMYTAWQFRNPGQRMRETHTFVLALVPNWKAWIIRKVLRVKLHVEVVR